VAFVLPTPARVYDEQETVVPLTAQVASPDLKCVPVGAAAGLMVLVIAARETVEIAATIPKTATIRRFRNFI
jgi:hypothetical protein